MIRNDNPGQGARQFSYEEVGEILRLIEESRAAEVRIELNGLKLHVVRGSGPEGPATELPTGESAAYPAASGEEVEEPEPAHTDGLPDSSGSDQGGEGGQSPPAGPPGCVPITAPMVGVFYRAPAPDEPPFVEQGGVVEPGDQVAVIEVMKLMNEIQTDIAGVVVRVDAPNGELVQYGEPLMWVEPQGDG